MKMLIKFDLFMYEGIHPMDMMNNLSKEFDFKILKSLPLSLGDCWFFWIECKNKPIFQIHYIKELEWKPFDYFENKGN